MMKNVSYTMIFALLTMLLLTSCAPGPDAVEETNLTMEATTTTDSSVDAVTESGDKAEGEIVPTDDDLDSNISSSGEATKPAESPVTEDGEDFLVFPDANVSIIPIPGYTVTSSPMMISMIAPGGSLAEGPVIALIAYSVTGNESLQSIADSMHNNISNIQSWSAEEEDFQDRPAIQIEYQTNAVIGQELLVSTSPTVTLIILCAAPPDQWEVTRPMCEMVMDSLEFLP